MKYFCNTHNRVIVKKSAIVQRGIRYADDLIFFLEDREDAVELRRKIDVFLAERGLNVKEAKTHLVQST